MYCDVVLESGGEYCDWLGIFVPKLLRVFNLGEQKVFTAGVRTLSWKNLIFGCIIAP